MNAVLETTEWTGAYQPNHIYLMDGNCAQAYIPLGIGKPVYFKKPMTIDQRGRSFKPVSSALFNVSSDSVKEVVGSTGKTYFVNAKTNTCSCPGFIFRGKCKHLTLNG